MTTPPPEPRGDADIDLEGVPGEEGIEDSDAAQQLETKPEEHRNYTDPEGPPEK